MSEETPKAPKTPPSNAKMYLRGTITNSIGLSILFGYPLVMVGLRDSLCGLLGCLADAVGGPRDARAKGESSGGGVVHLGRLGARSVGARDDGVGRSSAAA